MKPPNSGARAMVGVATAVVPAIFFVAAVWILAQEVRRISAGHLWAHLAAVTPAQWGSALLATACGYGALTLYDVIGLRVIGHKLPYRAAAQGALLSFSISNNVGLSWISGGSMRQRVYGPLGVPLADVARLTVFNSVTFFIGAFLLIGGVLIAEPAVVSPLVAVPREMVQLAGAGFWLAILLYLALCMVRRRPIGRGKVSLPVPKPAIAIAQILLSSADIGLAALALYLLLPANLGIGFGWLLGVYVVALSGSVLTHVPGGLGVLEALVLWGLPDTPRAPLLAALIAYRLVYYLIPLACALLVIARRTLGGGSSRLAPRAWRLAQRTVPAGAAALSLASGVLLLFSGAMPALDADLHLLRAFLPLPLLELSHLSGSVIGLGLVVLANALFRRYDTARQLAILLLLAGAAATILNGSGLPQALALAAVAVVLEAGGAAFHRRGSLWRNAVSPQWLMLSLAMVGLSVLVGFAAYSAVPYRNELWWQFAYDANAPRFLRASLVVSALAFGLLVARLAGPQRQRRAAEAADEAICEVVAASTETSANLALLGDKRFLRSDSGRSFLMYQVEGRSWIALAGPYGPPSERPELVRRFQELADADGGRPVFYEVPGDALDAYADAGLVAHKIGEEARIDLQSFTLEGSRAKPWRATLRRAEREGLSYAIVAAADVPAMLDELRTVSDAWLDAKGMPEKGFSLGYFDARYLAAFDCAVVRQGSRIVAFANLWFGARLGELSIDLMRHRPEAPHGTMMFLMLESMMWAKHAGFGWFNLGMAPLSGLSSHRLAPKWHRIGRIIFDQGERLYRFDGLRAFKDQFGPVWRPRYIVCRPGGLALARALRDCVRLISHPMSGSPPRAPARNRPGATLRQDPRFAPTRSAGMMT